MDATHWSGVCVVRVVITALAYGAAHTCISKCMWYMGCVSVWEHWAYEWLDARQERRTRTHTLRPASVKNEKHEERKAKWKKKHKSSEECVENHEKFLFDALPFSLHQRCPAMDPTCVFISFVGGHTKRVCWSARMLCRRGRRDRRIHRQRRTDTHETRGLLMSSH